VKKTIKILLMTTVVLVICLRCAVTAFAAEPPKSPGELAAIQAENDAYMGDGRQLASIAVAGNIVANGGTKPPVVVDPPVVVNPPAPPVNGGGGTVIIQPGGGTTVIQSPPKTIVIYPPAAPGAEAEPLPIEVAVPGNEPIYVSPNFDIPGGIIGAKRNGNWDWERFIIPGILLIAWLALLTFLGRFLFLAKKKKKEEEEDEAGAGAGEGAGTGALAGAGVAAVAGAGAAAGAQRDRAPIEAIFGKERP